MTTRRQVLAGGAAAFAFPVAAGAEEQMVTGGIQYIAALVDPAATSGIGAETWGLWEIDPGPRGVWLRDFPALQANGFVAPDGWTFDPAGWWVEEYGRIMEAPSFPLPAGKYVVSGAREVTSVLTVAEPDATGAQAWSLADGATIYDVTHLRCRAALYTLQEAAKSCAPDTIADGAFPVRPGDTMPAVAGCNKVDYQVLIVIGRMVEV